MVRTHNNTHKIYQNQEDFLAVIYIVAHMSDIKVDFAFSSRVKCYIAVFSCCEFKQIRAHVTTFQWPAVRTITGLSLTNLSSTEIQHVTL